MTTKTADDQLTIIKPGDENYQEHVTHRGKADKVGAALDPVVAEMLKNGETEFQLVPGDPFTKPQITYWAPRAAARLLDADKRISVSGGNRGKNLLVKIVERKAPAANPAAKNAGARKAAGKTAGKATKKPARRVVKKTA